MIREQIRQLDTGPQSLRRFGVLIGALLVLIAAVAIWRRHSSMGWLAFPGSLLLILALARPTLLKSGYIAWMAVGIALGVIVSTVLLAIFFL